MRIIFLIAILIPSIACASEWIELGKTPEARIMLDKENIETFNGGAKAWLKFLYHKKQPGQTITMGKPFDSSINQYYLVCSTKKFQVLQLILFYKNDTVGSVQASLDLNNFLEAKPGTGVMYLLNKICTSSKPHAATQKN
jgi:hypothetical protein